MVERTAEHPLVPLSLFIHRNRVMTFLSLFLAGGVLLTLTVMIGLYVQDVLGYSALRAGISFIPFAVALGLGQRVGGPGGAADRAALADHRRRLVRAGRDAVRLDTEPQDLLFPGLFVPIIVGGFGIGVISVILPLCALADVGPREIGPVVGDHADGAEPRRAARARRDPGGAGIAHAVPRRDHRTVRDMTPAQLDALDHGYTYSLLWVAAVAVLVGVSAFWIGYLGSADRGCAVHPRGGGGRRAVGPL